MYNIRSLCNLVVLVMLIVNINCQPEPPGPGLYPSQDVQSENFIDRDARGELPYNPDGETSDSVTGTWVLFTEIVNCVSFIGSEENVALTIARVEIVQDGVELSESRSTCLIEASEVFGMETVMPQAIYDGVNPYEVSSTLLGDSSGAAYDSGPELQLWGVELSDPFNDDLPTELGDPRIIDSDLDGNPGVTFVFNGGFCNMFAVERSVNFYQGRLISPTVIEGEVVTRTEEVIIDATNEFCSVSFDKVSYNLYNRFKLVRVDGINGAPALDLDQNNEVDCDEIIAFKNDLFEISQPDSGRCY